MVKKNKIYLTNVMRAIALIFSGMTFPAYADWQMNMPQGVTPVSHDMYNLHMIAMIVCLFIGIAVFGVMIYSLIHHRKSRNYEAASFHENTRLEIIWTILPFLILIGLAIPATKVLMRMEDTQASDVTIKIVGSQWKWQYQYLDQGISYFSNLATPYAQIQNEAKKNKWYLLEVDKPLVVPINKKLRFLVTSTDVIHSWWVPKLGVKRDAIPGFMHESWAIIEKPGTYRGQCTELCGVNHAYMPIVVKAVSQQEFAAWVAKQPKVGNPYKQVATDDQKLKRHELMILGKKQYEITCVACHQANGRGIPPLYPALKGSSVAIGNSIERHIKIILHGIPGSAMQSYKQLSDEEIAAVVTYERNAWGNNTNDTVYANDVLKVRNNDFKKPKIVKKVRSGGFR